MYLGRVLFVECSEICRFCKARRSALPMPMEERPAPRGPLLITLRRIQLAILWRSVTMKKKKKLHRQRKLSLHQIRKERLIGSKSRESPSSEDERGVNVDQ
eukprot:831906-Pelagomonas_calceolata.AAC.1